MSTSGVTAYTMTARDMVANAMIELGAINSGESPTADEMTDGITRLNSMLKTLQAKGCGLWLETGGTLTITANASSGTLPAGLRDVFGARVAVSGTFERTMAKWGRQEYLSLPNKAASGNPVAFYIDRQRDTLVFNVWPVPTADASIKLDYERIVETVTDASQDVDVPEVWFETIWKMLAARLVNMFGVGRLDPATAQRITAEASVLEQILLDDDRPDSVQMGPG